MIWFHAVSLCSHPCCVWQSLNEPTWALWSKQHFAGSVKTRNQQNSVSPRLSGFGFDSLGYVYSWSVLEFKATEALLKPKPWERERPWVKLCKLSMLVSSNVRSCVHVCAWWENNVKTMKNNVLKICQAIYIFGNVFQHFQNDAGVLSRHDQLKVRCSSRFKILSTCDQCSINIAMFNDFQQSNMHHCKTM